MNFVDPYSKKIKIKRALWNVVWTCLARPFPAAFGRKWKILLIRMWGGNVKYTCTIYSSAKIFMPWNLFMDDYACLADHTDIYNAAPITLGKHAIVSQYAYLCTATHDVGDKDFRLYAKAITIGDNAWVAAKAFVGPGVTIGDGAVVGATASVYKDVEEWTVVGGNPAKVINKRKFDIDV